MTALLRPASATRSAVVLGRARCAVGLIHASATGTLTLAGSDGCSRVFMPLGSSAGSSQGEPGLEPQVLAVPSGGLVEGVDLCGCQSPVRSQVEPHVVAGDGAPHGGEELRVDQG